jgi:AICAR transformylase/IMP cyclohydrolase PurH
LYPLKKQRFQHEPDIIEKIDIGGISLTRAKKKTATMVIRRSVDEDSLLFDHSKTKRSNNT